LAANQLASGWQFSHFLFKLVNNVETKMRNYSSRVKPASMKVPGNTALDKFEIAAALQEIGALLSLKGGQNRFKARAYQVGARAVAGLSDDIGTLIKEGRLTSIRGIGNALASQIKQLYFTGSSSVLEDLRQEFPPGIIQLSRVPGLTISKIERLHDALGITNIEDLKTACEAGKVRHVKSFGIKTEQKLLDAIANHESRDKRIHIHHALSINEQLSNYIRTSSDLVEISCAGSLRRWNETVSNICIVASSRRPAAILEHFLRFPLIMETESQTATQCTVRLADGVKASLTAVRPAEYAAALLFATGPEPHVKKLQQLTARKKLSLTERGLKTPVKKSSSRAAVRVASSFSEVKAEPDIYRLLGMQYVPPELREDEGEVEAALAGKLPEDLVTLQDIQGMVHCHTTYSDGKHSIEEMARAAEAMGMGYLTITDHSPTAFYAGGVTLDRLKRQWEEIDQVQEKVRVKLLKGTESDILASGALDYPDKILEQFDVIIASIHSRYKMDSERMTKRLLAAMRQPVFKIWGHALGRLIQRRPPFECRVEEVLDAIIESRAAVEINGDPYRLDMEPRWIREARKRNIRFVVSVDAHSTGAMNNLKFGVGTARRGWVRRDEVLNTLGVRAFTKAVRPYS
jgi:DNA polymerase (family X)